MVLLKAIPCSQFSAKKLVHFQNKLPNFHVKTKSYCCHAVRVKFIYYYEGKHSPSIKLNSRCRFWCFNAIFSNISAISWRPVLVLDETGVPGENHRHWESNW
jgi:hypothetical protein